MTWKRLVAIILSISLCASLSITSFAVTYTVEKGDSLSLIAAKMLGDQRRWSEIYDANKQTIKNPQLIYPGQVLYIPTKDHSNLNPDENIPIDSAETKKETEHVLTVKQDGTGHYKTIQAAVNAAQPGDTVEVYAGVYREQVIFPRGGTDEAHRITLKSHDGDSVTVTGSNVVSGWRKVDGHDGVWTVTLDKDCFTTDVLGNYFNPYANQWQSKVRGFYPSCGCIYVNGIPMDEAHSLENTTLNQTDSKGTVTTLDVAGLYDTKNTWMAEVDKETGITKILANFGTVNPNAAGVLVESNTRKQVITAAWNSGYITIDGIRVTNGSGPKTINFAQLGSKSMAGALSTHGGHHWIIENCDLSYNCGLWPWFPWIYV